jgi:hypothetical protein
MAADRPDFAPVIPAQAGIHGRSSNKRCRQAQRPWAYSLRSPLRGRPSAVLRAARLSAYAGAAKPELSEPSS